MKIIKKSLVVLLLIGSISIISCGDDSDDSASDPDPYVKFSGTGGYGSNEWSIGFIDYTEAPLTPVGSMRYGKFNAICLNTMNTLGTFSTNHNSMDHVCISTTGISKGNYPSANCKIWMRVNGKEASNQFQLNTQSVELTEVTGNYVKGTFRGKTPSAVEIEGSFVFKRTPDDTSWPFTDPWTW